MTTLAAGQDSSAMSVTISAPARSSAEGRLQLLRKHMTLAVLAAFAKKAWIYGTSGIAAGYLAYSAARLWRVLKPTLPKTHPGTAEWRRLVDNPVIPPHQFENRFTGGHDLESKGPWDFIIIGAGSAGCVIANRLSAYPGVRVLLIEAGGEAQNADAIKTPNRALELWRSEVDWGFRSTPQEHLLPKGRTINLERGLSLGGSSSINWVMWVQGQRQDFDRWSKQYGCGDDWSFERVITHYERLEHVTDARMVGKGAPHRGKSGPIRPGTVYPLLPEVVDFLDACAVNGIENANDYNDHNQGGAGPTQFCVQGGQRGDAFNMFVEPVVRTRKNITVVSECFVRRILFEGAAEPCATGVEIELNDQTVLTLRATREVILSAGAIGSPHILLLSGVGDQNELKELGVASVAHVPAVGKNLQDHPGVGILANVKTPFESVRNDSSGIQTVAFAHSPIDKKIAEEEGHPRGPDCEIMLMSRPSPGPSLVQKIATERLHELTFKTLGITAFNHPWLWRSMNLITGQIAKTLVSIQETPKSLTLMGIVGEMNHVESRGSVRLRSSDPRDKPLIDPNYLSDPRDVEKCKFFVSKCRDLWRHPSLFNRMESFVYAGSEHPPEALFDESFMEEELENHVRGLCGTTWHYSCTVRMGPKDDPTSACDPRLHVKGVQRLRCADASIMPVVNSANTNAISMVIGSVVSDFIAEEHGLRAPAPAGASRL